MRIVFIDLETGGTDPARHPIIQIAAVAVGPAFKELDAFETKVQFDKAAAEPAALQLNHWNAEIWSREAKDSTGAINSFSAFLKRYADVSQVSKRTGDEYFVAQLAGYNAASFDGPFLRQFYSVNAAFLPASYRVMDVMQRVLWFFHEHPSMTPPADFKLRTVCEYFSIPLHGAHDALADVRATAALAAHIAECV
jgi:DNA polymerase III epsilon subunit-like protein